MLWGQIARESTMLNSKSPGGKSPGGMLSGDELRSLRLAVSRSSHNPAIPTAHEHKFRLLGLVREMQGGLAATERGWMALSSRTLTLA
jgi:hypothetical protein